MQKCVALTVVPAGKQQSWAITQVEHTVYHSLATVYTENRHSCSGITWSHPKLHLADTTNHVQLHIRTAFGFRAFSQHSSPISWNSLLIRS